MKRIDKEVFREACHRYRSVISGEVYQNLSRKITDNFWQQIDWELHQYIHCYAAISSKKEINTFALLEQLMQINKIVAVPKADFDEVSMKHIQLESPDQLEETQWGIPEPASGKLIPPEKFDLIIVPMVGGDVECNRIGYGKGFYDRFLIQTNALKVGLCYSKCLSSIPINTNENDVRLDMIVTEHRTIYKTRP